MKLAVFGATGKTGRVVVAQALAGRHQIRALVRSPERAGFPAEVEIVRGDVRDTEAVDNTINGAEAIVSCLGAPLLQTFTADGRVNTYGMPNIVSAMRSHGVKRIVAMSSYGAGDSFHRMSAMMRFGMSTVMHGALADMNALEEILHASQLDWTVVRPVNLRNGPSRHRLAVDRPGLIFANDWATRTDVAAFMLASLGDTPTIRRVLLLSESP
ncbi:MAG: NAD(P)H-binding protein [Nitrospira sp.]